MPTSMRQFMVLQSAQRLGAVYEDVRFRAFRYNSPCNMTALDYEPTFPILGDNITGLARRAVTKSLKVELQQLAALKFPITTATNNRIHQIRLCVILVVIDKLFLSTAMTTLATCGKIGLDINPRPDGLFPDPACRWGGGTFRPPP